MGTVIGVVAFVVALLGLLAALGHVGYLAMLNNAARRRGVSGGATSDYVSSRWKVAGGTAGVALIALLLTNADTIPVDVIGLLLGGGAGIAAQQALGTTRKQFRGEL